MKDRSLQDSGESGHEDTLATGKFRKVRLACVVFNVPGDDRDIAIPAFTAPQLLGVSKIVEMVGSDFALTYSLAGFIFEKLVDYHSVEPGSIPSDKLYADWLREFRAKEGMIIGRIAGVA